MHAIANYSGALAFNKGLNPIDLYRVLVKAGAAELLIDDIDILRGFWGPKAAFQYLQQELYPPYDELPLEERFLIGVHFLESSWDDSPDLIRHALGKEFTSADILSWENDQGQSLLHQLNHNHLHCLYRMLTADQNKSRNKDESGKSFVWRELIREYISAGAALHAVDIRGCTPLLSLIGFYDCSQTQDLIFRYWHRERAGDIQKWLSDLETCGVDLLLYGEREKALFEKHYRNNLYVYLKTD